MATAPFQSKYRPFFQVIRDARLERKSWIEIAEILAKKHGVKGAAASSVYEFFKRGVTKGRRVPLGFPEEDADAPLPPGPSKVSSKTDEPRDAATPTKKPAKSSPSKNEDAVKRLMAKPVAKKSSSGWDTLDAETAKTEAEAEGAKRAKNKLI